MVSHSSTSFDEIIDHAREGCSAPTVVSAGVGDEASKVATKPTKRSSSVPSSKTSQPPERTSRWARLRADPRLGNAGWVLLPLRAFLGLTFVYAGSSKLLDRHYLDPSSPLGVHSQMLHAAATSPISALVTFSAHHATLTGLLIAFGEVAVGIGALLGLFTRLAAAGGVLLALSFFLTVSWQTTPYYYCSDIVFTFAWLPIMIAGDGGLFSITTLIRRRVRRQMRLPAVRPPQEGAKVGHEVDRRTVVGSGLLTAVIGAVVAVVGGTLALHRRPASRSATPQAGAAPSQGASGSAGAQTIAKVSDVAVGSGKSFTTASGDPAWLLHPTATTFTAFSAVCTHQGCPVKWSSSQFQCPCHGSTFDAKGQVISGPANTPLPSIPVQVVNGEVHTA